MIRALMVMTLLLATPLTCLAWTGRCVAVLEGDTISVTTWRTGRTGRLDYVAIRLYGVAAPARGQEFAKESRDFLATMVKGRDVEIVPMKPVFPSCPCLVMANGVNVNHEIVKAGMAWWSRRDAPQDQLFQKMEQEAREANRGLWAMPDPVPPWEYRQDMNKRPK
jgi:micrococcal nuclease